MSEKGSLNQEQQEEETASIPEPNEPEGSFAWKVLQIDDVKRLSRFKTFKELETKMAATMNIENYETDLREACLLDYYVTAFQWGKNQKFSVRQMSGFFTMIDVQIYNVRDNRFTKLESFAYIKQCFVWISDDNTNHTTQPNNVPLFFFNVEESKRIIDYVTRTFLKHHSLYEHVFAHEQDELIIGKEMAIEVCSESVKFPAPLEEAVHLTAYKRNINRDECVQVELSDDGEEEEHHVDERNMEEKFVDDVVNRLSNSDNPQMQAIDVAELRRVVEKFTKGILLPHKMGLEEKIREKEAKMLEKIVADKPPAEGKKGAKKKGK